MHGMDPLDEIDYWRARAEAAESGDGYSATVLRIMRERDAALTRAERAEDQLAAVTRARDEACEIANWLAVRDPFDDTCVVCQEQIVEGHECRVLQRLATLRAIGKSKADAVRSLESIRDELMAANLDVSLDDSPSTFAHHVFVLRMAVEELSARVDELRAIGKGGNRG